VNDFILEINFTVACMTSKTTWRNKGQGDKVSYLWLCWETLGPRSKASKVQLQVFAGSPSLSIDVE
jgi:hypothetical protein